MRPRHRTGWIAAACLVVLGGCGGADDGLGPPTDVAIVVGPTKITNAQITRRAEFLASTPGTTTDLAVQRMTAATQLRDEAVFAILAARCGRPCAVTPAEVQKHVAAVVAESYGGSEERFAAFLAERHLTREEFVQGAAAGIRLQRLEASVRRSVRFTDAQVRADYAAHPESYRVPATRHVWHILLADRAAALALRPTLTAANFAATAKRTSTEPAARTTGGDLGDIRAPTLDADLSAAARRLRVGEISQPVQSRFGWSLMMVTDAPARTIPLSEARPRIVADQRSMLETRALERWRGTVVRGVQNRVRYLNPKVVPPDAPATTATP